MKKLITLILSVLLTFSCSSNDDNNDSEEGLIIGTWHGVSSTFNGNNSGVPDNNIVKFTSNNRVEFIYEDFGNNGEDIIETGSWSKSGNTLIIIWDESDAGLETYVLTITELSSTSLAWKTVIAGEGNLNEKFVKAENVEVSQIDPKDIIGEWEYYTQEYKNYGTFSELPYLATDCRLDEYIEYTDTGAAKRYDIETRTYNTNENTEENGFIIRHYTCSGNIAYRGERQYSISGNSIKWTNPDQSITYGIIHSLDQEKFILLWNDNLQEFSDWKTRVTFKRR